MSSNYNLQEDKDWMFSFMKPLFEMSNNINEDEFEKKMIDVFKESEKEIFSCKDKSENQGMFGCEFFTQEDGEKYCDSKNDCLGYIKFYEPSIKTYKYVPTKKLPIKNNNEELKTILGEVLFYKKKENKDKIFGIDKNTFYIILLIILIIIGYMFYK